MPRLVGIVIGRAARPTACALGVAVLALLWAVLVAVATARSAATQPISGSLVLQPVLVAQYSVVEPELRVSARATEPVAPGDELAARYEARVDQGELSGLAFSSSHCGSLDEPSAGDVDGDDSLDEGETWVYRCEVPADSAIDRVTLIGQLADGSTVRAFDERTFKYLPDVDPEVEPGDDNDSRSQAEDPDETDADDESDGESDNESRADDAADEDDGGSVEPDEANEADEGEDLAAGGSTGAGSTSARSLVFWAMSGAAAAFLLLALLHLLRRRRLPRTQERLFF